MMMPTERIDTASAAEAAEAALDVVLQVARESISARGRFVLVLAGGSTPAQLYQLLATAQQDWSHWYLIYGDERCLPAGHPQRNSTLVAQSWLDQAHFPRANECMPPAELGPADAAVAYSTAIAEFLPPDMALLGMGEDGHTASLFPGQNYPDAAVVPVYDAPKPPAERISLSYRTLCSARVVCFLAAGAGKLGVVEAYFAGQDLPVNRVHGSERTLLVAGGIAGGLAHSTAPG